MISLSLQLTEASAKPLFFLHPSGSQPFLHVGITLRVLQGLLPRHTLDQLRLHRWNGTQVEEIVKPPGGSSVWLRLRATDGDDWGTAESGTQGGA